MNYVVIDLEWNQYHNPLRTPVSKNGIKMHEEIIQIGAVKTDHQMNPLDTFSLFVRLGGGRRLDKYVKKLTHISDFDISCGEDFSVAAEEFSQWLQDVDAIFSWGADDRRVFLNNLAFYDLPAPVCAWYDAQKIYSRQVPDHGGLALKSVAEAMNVHVSLTLHDAMNDAILTAFCMSSLDMEDGVANYNVRPTEPGEESTLQPVYTAKTHRYSTQQAAWEEACNGLLRCPACMQNLEWVGDESGNIARWYKTARCQTHGDYVLKGEFLGDRMAQLKLSFYPSTPEVLDMVKKDTEPAETASKKRRRRRKKSTKTEVSAVSLSPDEMLSRAVSSAAQKLKEQTTPAGNVPRIVHAMELASIMGTMTDDACLISAAILCDVDDTSESVEREYGAHVADLVSFVREAPQNDEAPKSWHEQRQAALEKLKTADAEQKMLALSICLSEMRTVGRDYERMKNELWSHTEQSDKKEQAWYYRALAEEFSALQDTDAAKEFTRLVQSVFGKPRKSKKSEEKQSN